MEYGIFAKARTEPQTKIQALYLKKPKNIFTIAEKYLFNHRYLKIGSLNQIQSQKSASIQVRPNLYLDPS